MHLGVIASLTLAALISGLDGEQADKKEAKAFVASEIESLVAEERKTMIAPPNWFACISEAKSSRVLEREVLRLYREEESARIMNPGELVRWAVDEICEDAYYEN